jgi:hypothetical protein
MARFVCITNAPKFFRASLLYERKAVTDLWNRLTAVTKQQWKWRNVDDKTNVSWRKYNIDSRLLLVYGPPGSGKSTATLQWVYSVCKILPDVQCLWINCEEHHDAGCWKINMSATTGQVVMEKHHMPSKDDKDQFTHLVVLDGVQGVSFEIWKGLINAMAREGTAVIIASSEGVRFRARDSPDILKFEHFVPSWTQQEYYDACGNDEFWDTVYPYFGGNSDDDIVRRTQLIDSKFDIAGHSARFMFSVLTTHVRRQISGLADSLGLNARTLEDAVKSNRSIGAVNSLVARLHDNKNGVTPEYKASFPTLEDLTRVASNSFDLMPLESEEEEEPLNSTQCIVSKFAVAAIIGKIGWSDIEKIPSLARTLDNKVIEGYAVEQQLEKISVKHL